MLHAPKQRSGMPECAVTNNSCIQSRKAAAPPADDLANNERPATVLEWLKARAIVCVRAPWEIPRYARIRGSSRLRPERLEIATELPAAGVHPRLRYHTGRPRQRRRDRPVRAGSTGCDALAADGCGDGHAPIAVSDPSVTAPNPRRHFQYQPLTRTDNHRIRLDEQYTAFIPSGRAINTVTGTN